MVLIMTIPVLMLLLLIRLAVTPATYPRSTPAPTPGYTHEDQLASSQRRLFVYKRFYWDLTRFWAPKPSKHWDLSVLSHARMLKTMRGPNVWAPIRPRHWDLSAFVRSHSPKPVRVPMSHISDVASQSLEAAVSKSSRTRIRFADLASMSASFIGSVPAEIA